MKETRVVALDQYKWRNMDSEEINLTIRQQHREQLTSEPGLLITPAESINIKKQGTNKSLLHRSLQSYNKIYNRSQRNRHWTFLRDGTSESHSKLSTLPKDEAKRNYTQIQETIYKSEAPTLFNYSNPDAVHHDKVCYYAIHKITGHTLVPNVSNAQYALES